MKIWERIGNLLKYCIFWKKKLEIWKKFGKIFGNLEEKWEFEKNLEEKLDLILENWTWNGNYNENKLLLWYLPTSSFEIFLIKVY